MNKTLIIILVVIVVLIGGYFLFFNKSGTPIVENNPTSAGLETTNPKVNGTPVESGAKMETGTVSTVKNTVNVAKKVTVNYTNSGFSPKTITIKKGDAVTFVNESSGGMSVASDPHPTHTDYPEFDQFKSPEKGQKSYTFVFDKVGSWGYHNHLNPSMVGTVVVE
jgi:plastocyanin